MLIKNIKEYKTERNETRYYVEMGYDADFISRMKESISWPNRMWDPDKKMWSFSKRGLDEFRNLPGIIFYEEALNEVIDTSEFMLPVPGEMLTDINWDKFTRPATEFEPELKLWDFQKLGISRIIRGKTHGLWYEMGLGKTYTSICTAKELMDRGLIKQCLVISIVSIALDSWMHTLDRMGYSYRLILGPVKLRAMAIAEATEDFILTLDTSCTEEAYPYTIQEFTKTGRKRRQRNRSIVDVAVEKEGLITIIDEIHKLSNTQSKTFKAMKKIGESCEYRIALTGTVLKSTPEKALLPLRFLYPTVFSNKGAFEEAFTIKEMTRFGLKTIGYRNIDILKEILHRAGMPALKKDHLKELPELLPPKLIICDTDQCSIDIISKIRNDNSGIFERPTDANHHVVNDLFIKTYEALVCPEIFDKSYVAENRLQTVCNCLDSLDGKTVIFTTLKMAIKGIYNYLTNAGYKCTCCSGDQDLNEIQRRVDKFVGDDCDVLIATIQKMGTGFDRLKVAQNVIIYDFNTNGADLRQAIDRLHRNGQLHAVSVIYISQDNAVAEYLYRKVMMQVKLMSDVEDTNKREIESAVDLREILALVADSNNFLRRRKKK